MADSTMHHDARGSGGGTCARIRPVARAAFLNISVLLVFFWAAGCAGRNPHPVAPVETLSIQETRYAVIKYSSRVDLAGFSKSLGRDKGNVGLRVDELFAWTSSTLDVPPSGKTQIRVMPDLAALNGAYAVLVDENQRVAGSKAAFFDRRSNTIYFPARGSHETTLVHEMVHALVMNRSPFLWYSLQWHERLAQEVALLFTETGGKPVRASGRPDGLLPERDADFERGGRQGAAPNYPGVKGVLGKLLDE